MKNWISFLFVVLMTSSVVRAGITVTITPSDQSTGAGTYLSGSDIHVATAFSGAGHAEVVVEIVGLATDSVGAVTVLATSTVPVTVVARGGTTGSLLSITSIDTTGSTSPVLLQEIRARTIGSVHADDINFIQATTEIGGIRSQHDINSVVTGGFRGDILAESGSITQLYCSAGTVGTSTAPIAIRAGGTIGHILGESIYADISGPVDDSNSVRIGRISIGNGHFIGSVRMEQFFGPVPNVGAPEVYVSGGNLDADITIAGDYDFSSTSPGSRPVIKLFTSGSTIPAGRTITIAGGLIGANFLGNPAAIELPANGLQGQIIINAAGGSGAWTAPVQVDGYKLDDNEPQPRTAPHYELVSASLGGGSIGLVPFSLHGTDCTPANGGIECTMPTKTWPSAPTTRETFALAFYGPVLDSLPSDGTIPLVVEKQSMVCEYGQCPSPWEDISDECSVLVAPSGLPRQVWVCLTPIGGVAQPFDTAYRYRATPRSASGVTDLRSA